MGYTVTIRDDTLQSVDGFGMSASWSAGEIMRLPETEKQKALGMFFTPQGAAMSILRLRVVPKSDDDFQAQAEMCKWAEAQGVTRFYATNWGVPAQFLDGSQKLLPARFGDFAAYLTGYIRDMGVEGIPIGWIGVQNEPDNGPKLAAYTVDYNRYTVHYYRSKAELRDFSVVLKKALADEGLGTVKLLGPECMGWEGTREFTKAQFESPAGIQAMDVIGTHDYWGAERDSDMDPVRVEMAGIAKANKKRIWQTEYSRVDCLPGCPNACAYPSVAQDPARILTQADFNMNDGLEMVNYLYKDFSKANASAWLFWWTHNPNKGCGENGPGMHNSFNGLAILKADNTFFFPKRFHALSHYTRFVRPGASRLALETDGEAAAHPLAFVDRAKDQVIVVMFNAGTAAAPISMKLPGFPSHLSVTHYRTTQAADMNVVLQETRQLAPGSAYAAEMAPRSVSTLVFERSGPSLLRESDAARAGGNGSLAGGILYQAAAGERVVLWAVNLRGKVLASERITHTAAGKFAWSFPGAGAEPYVIQLEYPGRAGSGVPLRRLILPSGR